MSRIRTSLVGLIAWCGCGPPLPEAAPGNPVGEEVPNTSQRAPEVCSAGATQCVGLDVQICEPHSGGAAWSAPAACEGEESCRDGRCQPPTDRVLSQATAIEKWIETLASRNAWHKPTDATSVLTRERNAVIRGDGRDATFFGAAWRSLLAFPQGHQSLYSEDPEVCGTTLPNQLTSRFGVCGRPSTVGLVVTRARTGNRLGLSPGDTIIRAGQDNGADLLEVSYARPVCGVVYPSHAGRLAAGAASFFAHVPSGMKLQVRGIDGSMREIVVPNERDPEDTHCLDPFGRNLEVYTEVTQRPDGVVVIRLPSFMPYDKSFPNTNDRSVIDAFIEEYRQALLARFRTVQSARAIIWDVRGNTGGFTPIAISIISGIGTARRLEASYCQTRTPRTNPPRFSAARYAEYTIDPDPSFAFAGKVAIVADGLAYSAGDYFPWFARKATNAITVGSSTAGAFGGGAAPVTIDGPPTLRGVYDPTACFDKETSQPLEGSPLEPTIQVDYDPSDLAAGRDTFVERAAAALTP